MSQSSPTATDVNPAIRVTRFDCAAHHATKAYHLDADGGLVASDRSHFSQATARVIELGTDPEQAMAALAGALNAWPDTGVLCLGVPSVPPGDDGTWDVIVDGKMPLPPPPGLISRTLKYLRHPKGPGVLMIDIDPEGPPPDVLERVRAGGGWWQALQEAVPLIAEAAHVTRASTSAGLFREADGTLFKPDPLRHGQHVFMVLDDASRSTEVLEALAVLAAAAGMCWATVDGNGHTRDRTPVDTTVGSAERVVYEAPPRLSGGIGQRPRPAEAWAGGAVCADAIIHATRTARPAAEGNLIPRHAAVSEQAKAVKEAHRQARAEQMAAEKGIPVEAARAFIDTLKTFELTDTDTLHFKDPRLGTVTVAQVRSNLRAYHKQYCADPIEGPAYKSGCGVATLWVRPGGEFIIHSFAHGEKRIFTYRAPPAALGPEFVMRRYTRHAGGQASAQPGPRLEAEVMERQAQAAVGEDEEVEEEDAGGLRRDDSGVDAHTIAGYLALEIEHAEEAKRSDGNRDIYAPQLEERQVYLFSLFDGLPDLLIGAGNVNAMLDRLRPIFGQLFRVTGNVSRPSDTQWFYWGGGASPWVADKNGQSAGKVIGDLLLALEQLPGADDENDLMANVREVAGAKGTLAALMKGLRQSAECWWDGAALDDHHATQVIGHPSFVTEIETGLTRRYRRCDRITMATAVDPKPGPHPLWDEMLDNHAASDPDLLRWLHDRIASCLVPKRRIRKGLVISGPQDTNKSPVLQGLHYLLGDYSAVIPNGLIESESRKGGFGTTAMSASHMGDAIAGLNGKLFAWIDELDKTSKLNVRMIKQMSTSDTMSARQLHKSHGNVRLRCMIAVATNHDLSVDDGEEGLAKRMELFRTRHQPIPRHLQDGQFLARLNAEAPAFLATLLKAASALWRTERVDQIDVPMQVAQTSDALEDASRPWLQQFLMDCLEIDMRQPDWFVTVADLRQAVIGHVAACAALGVEADEDAAVQMTQRRGAIPDALKGTSYRGRFEEFNVLGGLDQVTRHLRSLSGAKVNGKFINIAGAKNVTAPKSRDRGFHFCKLRGMK